MNKHLQNTLIVLPWLFVVYLFVKYAVNLPYKDDYRVFISFFKFYLNAHTLPQKLQVINIPDNESTPIIMRLISIIQYHLSGGINFKHILVFCWLFLFLTQWVLVKTFSLNNWLMASVGFWIINSAHHEMIFRTDVATYQLATFGMSLYMLFVAFNFNQRSWFQKLFFLLIFIATPGGSINGMLANLLVVNIFALQSNKKMLATSMVIFSIQLLYLFVLKTGGKSFGLIDNLIKYNVELIIAYLVSLGGIFNIRVSSFFNWVSGVSGVFMLVLGIKYFLWKNPQKWDVKSMIFIFCALSLAAIVALRYNYWMVGLPGILESRYKMYGAVIVLLILGEVSKHVGYKWYDKSVFFYSLMLFLIWFYKGDFIQKDQKLTQLTDAYNINNQVIDSVNARVFFVEYPAVKLLRDNKAFDFESVSEEMDSIIKKSDKLSFDGFQFTEILNEIEDNADWTTDRIKNKSLIVNGRFKYYKAYIMKFDLPNGKSAIFYLYGKPQTIYEKLFPKSYSTSQLSHDIKFDIYTDLKNAKATLYGLHTLPL